MTLVLRSAVDDQGHDMIIKGWASGNWPSRLIALFLVTALGIVGIVPAADATPAGNKIWNGYVTKSGKRTKVSGTWQVPTLTCGIAASNASQWIGLAGVDAPLVQIGIISRCSLGLQQNHAFYQVVPKDARDQVIVGEVTPGDLIDASVTYLGGHRYRVHITENAWSWDFTKIVRQPNMGTTPKTAEWIVEGGSGQALSNFGTVHFEEALFNKRTSLTNANGVKYIADTRSGKPKTKVSKVSPYGGHGPNFTVKRLRK